MTLTTRIETLRVAQKGMTLVEIAIVMIVIALLIAGILVGQELVAQARVKSTIADFSGIAVAYGAYRDRYKTVPGDDPGAAARWPAPTAATNGNGDGQVAGTYNNGNAACTAAVESCNWWDHLRRAGFMSGSGAVQPVNAFLGLLGVQTGDGATFGPALGGPGGTAGLTELMLCSANLPDKIAAAVDLQIDDGVRTTGAFRGMLQATPNPPIAVDATAVGAGGAASYVEAGTNVYVLCGLLGGR